MASEDSSPASPLSLFLSRNLPKVPGSPSSSSPCSSSFSAHAAEKEDEQGDEDDGDPGTFGKFRDKNNDNGDAGDESSEAIDQCALQPMLAALFPPVHDHAELRERKGQESSHRIERDEFVRDTIENNQQEASEHAENDDAVGVDQAAAAIDEGVRQVIVLRDGATETREIGERGVRGKG